MLTARAHLVDQSSQADTCQQVSLPMLLGRTRKQPSKAMRASVGVDHFKEGQTLEYHSMTAGGWIRCTVVMVFENGDVEIDVKRGYRFPASEACKLLRSVQPETDVRGYELSHSSISKNTREETARPTKKHRSMKGDELQTAMSMAQAALDGCSDFSVEDLQMGSTHDPAQDPSLKAQILLKLGLSESSSIKKMSGSCGGQNSGVWVIQDTQSQSTLILKLVSSRGIFGPLPSEAQKLQALYEKHPSIVNDVSLAFPLKIFKCIGLASEHSHDFIVMRKVSGESLADIMCDKYRDGKISELMPVLRELGMFLAQFHRRYSNSQHGDFHASNIFYDASSGSFTLIDVADVGNRFIAKRDITYFCETLSLMSSMGEHADEGKRNFEAGYSMGQ